MSLTAKPTRRKSRLPSSLAMAAIGLAVLVVAFIGWQVLKPKPLKDPYRTEAVAMGDVTKSVSASGSLQALVTVQVGSQISGQITKVLVDFNDQVSKGQVMAILDPQTYVSRANQGRAQVQAGNASLAQAQAQAAVAKANYDRTRMLFDKGIAAKAALDTDLASWKVALAGVKAAQANIAQSKAALASTEVDLGRTTIVAPIAGVVVDRQIEPGQTVAASLQAPVLFQIAQDLTQLEVKINVDEADIGQVREGQTVKFTVDAFPDDSFTGVVTQVRKQPETQSNVVAYIVIARAENPGGKLLPGMTANADIVIDERKNVLKVPVAALRWTPPDKTTTPRGMGGGPGGPPGGGGGGQGFGGRPGRGQGGGGGGMGMRLIEQLDLDAGQQAKAKVIFDQARQNVMAAGYSDPQARRAAMRTAMQAAFAKLEPILKPDQKTKLVALRAQMAAQGGQRRGGMTPGVVWVLKDGKPTPIQVMVGASDGSYSEIRGNIPVGSQVITGGGPKPKVKARSPMAGPGVRVRM
ncbi:HlyD family secretion protein [Caulobacter ginsengisoli]|uniref:HlyD family secretion protein n=1 Tax=Caulobacter ginsengisoli TaxID=400775 RepID=A0ABU0IRY6_9CAUL|nr:efflux RND transporter periplasmic adaptor subunit [Caulobacter ginsengisoli]MDQ0464175.1 HlyD family secretion protein [Caulobacter ginsengisoli]